VLAPGLGVIIGGSQREERLEILDTRMAEHGIDREHHAPPFPPPQAREG
jgi:asparaginyl-tRNA synthetase